MKWEEKNPTHVNWTGRSIAKSMFKRTRSGRRNADQVCLAIIMTDVKHPTPTADTDDTEIV